MFNLGYFEEVNVSTEQGSTPDRIVVNIEVKERATGLFSIGAGYSSVDSLFATVDVSQRNLFGRGQEAFLRVPHRLPEPAGPRRLHGALPLRHPLRAGFDIYDRERKYELHRGAPRRRHPGELPLTEYLSISGL